MIRYELLRMLRNRKWKYLIPAALLAYIYISGVSSLTVTEGSIYQDQQIQHAWYPFCFSALFIRLHGKKNHRFPGRCSWLFPLPAVKAISANCVYYCCSSSLPLLSVLVFMQ